MGVCCQQKDENEGLVLYDYGAKGMPKSPEEIEKQFKEMLKRIDINDPFMKVFGYLNV
jgi:alpha-mannosidase